MPFFAFICLISESKTAGTDFPAKADKITGASIEEARVTEEEEKRQPDSVDIFPEEDTSELNAAILWGIVESEYPTHNDE